MIEINYKSELMFYEYTKETNHQQKNEKIRKKTYKMGEPMTQERYANEILPIVKARKKEVEATGGHFVFQEDNDGSHGTRLDENIARFRKVEMKLEFIESWPPNSPDLNPIENVWRILKSRVKRHKCMTPKQLRKAIEQEWKKITLKEVNECILNRPKGKSDARGV
jgi:transposase